MDTPAAPVETSPIAPPLPRRALFAKVVLGAFLLYIVAIYVLTLDQALHWGLFPSRAEKQIAVQIQQLGNSSLTKEQRDTAMQDIVNWNTFAVPALLKAIEKDPPEIRDQAVKCLQTIAFKFYNVDIAKYGSDPVKLKQWWADLQAQWLKAEQDKSKK